MSLPTRDEPAAPHRRGGPAVVVGLVVLIAGLLCLALGRLEAEGGHHAYDPNAAVPSSYHLTAGTTYQLSTPGGVQKLTGDGVLASGIDPQCQADGADDVQQQLRISSTFSDARDLDTFASFEVDETGDYTIHCNDVAEVFVDDADSVGFDTSGLLTVLSTLLLVVGVGLICSGAYRLSGHRGTPGARRRWEEQPD